MSNMIGWDIVVFLSVFKNYISFENKNIHFTSDLIKTHLDLINVASDQDSRNFLLSLEN